MKTICATLFLLGFVSLPLLAQTAVSKAKPSTPVEQEIIELERQWAAVIKSQDISAASRLLSEDHFLAIGVQGAPLQIFPRKVWLETLKFYVTESYSIDDIKIHIHGDTAVVVMLFTQKATMRGQDRSAQFVITDIWVKQKGGWRVAERHSSRPELQGSRKRQMF